jgi:hypothetical protein
MPSSGMLRRVALVRADASEECIASIIWVTRTANVVPCSPILVILMIEEICSSDASGLTRAIGRHIPEDGILHRHRRENLKSYTALDGWALYRRRNVSSLKYELGFYIPEDILHSYRRESLKSYIALTGLAL